MVQAHMHWTIWLKDNLKDRWKLGNIAFSVAQYKIKWFVTFFFNKVNDLK